MTRRMATHSWRAVMRALNRPLVCGALLAGSFSLPVDAIVAAPPSGQTIYTSRPKFRIPFQFDAEEMARLGAVEIRLFTSTDSGRHWQHAQSVAPGEGRFTFEATGEGEYWFAVRTVDGQGQLHPPGPPQSGLQVIVDQTVPQLEIRVQEVQPGEVELSWRASDEHLNLQSLKLQFLEAGSADWQEVSITPAESGQTSWSVSGRGQVFVRASVSDQAQNSASADASTAASGGNSPASPAAQPSDIKPDFSRPVAAEPLPPGNQDLALDQSPVVIPNGSSVPFPAPQQLITQMPAQVPVTPRAVSGPTQAPVVVETPESFRTTPAAEAAAPSEGMPTRYVRSREFTVQYEIDDVGPSGVSSVDLYITENNGAKWYHYGQDEDRRSPVSVELQKDGEYGFDLRVRSGAGVVQEPPQPGDLPAFVVVVDRKPPQAELVNVAPTSDGEITVEWTVKDERPADRPVRLSCAPSREGPWRAMTDWIPNSGRHQWRPDDEQSRAPVYLRLEVRDAAGNMARVDSQSPLLLDSARPSARFTDIQSGASVIPQ